MNKFKACFYRLEDWELDRARFKEESYQRALKTDPDRKPNHYQLSRNLDLRKPFSVESLMTDVIELNRELIAEYKNKNIFAIDIRSLDDTLISRYLLVPKENFSKDDTSNSSFRISDHVYCFMHHPDNANIYTIDGIIEN